MEADPITQEVHEILVHAERPLSCGEVYARSELAEGRATVAEALSRLVKEGRAKRSAADNGGHLYRAAEAAGQPATAESREDQVDGSAPATGQSKPRPRRSGLRERARAAIALREDEFLPHELAEALSADNRDVSRLLCQLHARGEVTRRQIGLQRYAYRRREDGDTEAEQRPNSASSEPAKPEADSRGADHMYLRRIQGERARYAYRSDGTLLIEPPDQESIELDRAAAERLYRYLTGVHHGVLRALGGGE